MKKLSIVWGLTMLIVFGSLTFFGFKFQEIKEYKFLEMDMKDYAKKYIKDQDNFEYKKPFKITLDELKKEYDDKKLTVKDCDGYVNVNKNFFGLKYKSYINCTKYETNK